MKTIDLKLNVDLAGKKAGTVITVQIDENKTIIDRYWRRRFEDSVIDGCVETFKKNRGEKS